MKSSTCRPGNPSRLLPRALAAVALLAAAIGVPGAARAQNTCNMFISIAYTNAPSPPAVVAVGDIVRVQLTLGADGIQGGTKVDITRLRFDLDCNADFALGTGCTDDGPLVDFVGNITTTCGVAFAPSQGSSANQVLFTATPAITIPANTQNFCNIEFDVQVVSTPSSDSTPTLIEQVGGYSAATNDAKCDNNLASSGSQSASISICPPCNEGDEGTDGSFCTTPSCNADTGECQDGPPKPCNEGDEGTDGNFCTPPSCDTATGNCVDGTAKPCNEGDEGTDGSFCTPPSCDTATGNCVDGAAKPCNEGDTGTDGNFCTPPSCDTASGNCVDGTAKPCNEGDPGTDGNFCTPPSCDTASGNCVDGTAKPCNEGDPGTDGNFCTPPSCNTATGNCVDGTAKPCNEGDPGTDGNLCTTPSCNTATGNCQDGAPKPCNEGDPGTDNNFCTTPSCDTATGNCTDGTPKVCVEGDPGTDGSLCTTPTCNSTSGTCEEGPPKPCNEGDPGTDGNLCTPPSCNSETGNCQDGPPKTCDDDGDPCTTSQCNPDTGECEATGSGGGSFLVRDRCQLGNRSTIAGDVGANNDGGLIKLGRGSTMASGTTLRADTVILGEGTVIDNVETNTFIGTNATVNGTKTLQLSLPLTDPFCPVPTFACGGADVIVVSRASKDLAPGAYGRIVVLAGGTLNLTPGTYEFCSISTARHARIRATGAGTTTINVEGDVRIANSASLGPASGSPTPILNVGGDNLRVGARATLQAFTSAPNAFGSFGRGAGLLGTFCFEGCRSDKGIDISCPPAPPD